MPSASSELLLGHRDHGRIQGHVQRLLAAVGLGSLRLRLASRYLVFSRLVRVPFRVPRLGAMMTSTAPGPVLCPGVPHRFSPQGDDGPLKFPGYPCMHMPRSAIPVVSSSLALSLQGLQPSGASKPSAFPSLRPVILMDHNNQLFGTRSRGLHTRYTWLHTHPCGLRTQVH